MSSAATSFEWYPPSWMDRLDDPIVVSDEAVLMDAEEFFKWLETSSPEEKPRQTEPNEGWYTFCPPCMEYVVHTRPGGGWVALGAGEADFPCSRCGEPLP